MFPPYCPIYIFYLISALPGWVFFHMLHIWLLLVNLYFLMVDSPHGIVEFYFLFFTLLSTKKQWWGLNCFLLDHISYVNQLQGRWPYIFAGQFMFDHMSVANILNNQEIAQALADGLMELSKDNSVSVSSKKANLFLFFFFKESQL